MDAKWMLNGFKLCFKICTMTTAKNCLFDCLFQTQSDFGWTWEGVAVSLVFPTGISRRKWWVWPTSLWILWRQPPPRRDLVLWWSSSIVHCVMISLLLSRCPWCVCLIIWYIFLPSRSLMRSPSKSMHIHAFVIWWLMALTMTEFHCSAGVLSKTVAEGLRWHAPERCDITHPGTSGAWCSRGWMKLKAMQMGQRKRGYIHLQIVTRMHIVHILVWHAS